MNAVLILNQDYTPLTICSVERAFLLVFLKKADLIIEIKEKRFRSISQTFPFPSIIKVKNYISIPYRRVVMSKHNIFKRDEGKCQYCGTHKELTIDHVIPRSKGGESTWTNLVTACKKCNSRKSDYTLEKSGMKLLKKPVKISYITFLRMYNSNKHNGNDWSTYLTSKKSNA